MGTDTIYLWMPAAATYQETVQAGGKVSQPMEPQLFV
jgi:hypothetical protein